jgi:polyhydroxyalkanoate synthesis regulator phasin
MVDTPQPAESKPNNTEGAPPAAPAPRRAPGHRSTDVRDTVAEMAARAQEISQEAGSKIALAMKDVISAAAGLTGFTIESARDVVQYMVRRGQMAQEEADRIIREAEAAQGQRKPAVPPRPAPPPSAPAPAPAAALKVPPKPVPSAPAPKAAPAKAAAVKAAPVKAAPKTAAKPAAHAAKPPAKPAAKTAARPARARTKPTAKTAAARKKK